MTDIQVKYWTYKEGQRHNLAMESETFRHNSATEVQAANELTESQRHNLATEFETNRHNTATEVQQRNELREERRHHIAEEGIGRQQAQASMIQAYASQSQAASRAKEVALKAEQQKYVIQKLQSETNLNYQQSHKLAEEMRKIVSEVQLTEYKTETEKQKAIVAEVEAIAKSANIPMQIFKENYKWILDAFLGNVEKAGDIAKVAAAVFA